MEVKFNSLFDNDYYTQKNSDYYMVDTQDTILQLSNLVLSENIGKSEAVKKLGKRPFGNYPNYLLSGRPCATRGCPPDKFCDSSGWPESPVFKPTNPCEMPFAPNSQRGDPNLWARNIEMESKLRNIDFIDSKCHLKYHKEDPCKNNPEECALSCHKDAISSDYLLPKTERKWDIEETPTFSKLSDGVNRIKNNHKRSCEKAAEDIKKGMQVHSELFAPTKRINTIQW